MSHKASNSTLLNLYIINLYTHADRCEHVCVCVFKELRQPSSNFFCNGRWGALLKFQGAPIKQGYNMNRYDINIEYQFVTFFKCAWAPEDRMIWLPLRRSGSWFFFPINCRIQYNFYLHFLAVHFSRWIVVYIFWE